MERLFLEIITKGKKKTSICLQIIKKALPLRHVSKKKITDKRIMIVMNVLHTLVNLHNLIIRVVVVSSKA